MVLLPLDHRHWMFIPRLTIGGDGSSMVLPNLRATMVMTQERRPKKARDDSISHPNKVQNYYDKERRGIDICKIKNSTVDCLTFAQSLQPLHSFNDFIGHHHH